MLAKIALWLHDNWVLAGGAFLSAFISAALLTPLVIKIARAQGLIAKPSSDRWHRQPTALFGGIAIFLTAVLCAWYFLPLALQLPGQAERVWVFLGLGAGATFMFFAGIYDDLKSLRPRPSWWRN